MSAGYRAWRIADGRTELIKIPSGADADHCWTLPENIGVESLSGDLAALCLLPGKEDPNFESFSLPLVEDAVNRITPWAVVYFSSSFFGAGSWSGMAWAKSECAIVRTNFSPRVTISTTYHECWHLCEELMSNEILSELDERLSSTGPPWPGDYYPRVKERRARAFESFCMYLVEGGRINLLEESPLELRLFYHVYSGGFASEIMAQRSSIPEPKPSFLKKLVSIF